jgi:hypothetical protein
MVYKGIKMELSLLNIEQFLLQGLLLPNNLLLPVVEKLEKKILQEENEE